MTLTVSDALNKFFSEAEYPILFTGAGISVRAGLPTWRRLVDQLAGQIQSCDALAAQQMRESISSGDYTHAVEFFKLSKKMLDGDKQKILSKLLSTYDETPILPLTELPFRGCVTTNFDRSIFDAIALSKKQTARDYKYGDPSFRQAQWEELLFVARIHGSVELPESMVLSDTQFRDLLADETYSDLLRTCFVQRNVLFLGFSFYDPAIRYIFEQLDKRFGSASPGRHMALVPADIDSEFLRKATRLNIEVVSYDAVDDHKSLWEGIKTFNERRLIPSVQSVKASPFDFTKRYLAACYARSKSQGSSTALRESVLEGIVSAILQEMSPRAIAWRDLLEKIRLAVGLKAEDIEPALLSAVESLVDAGLCRKLKAASGRGFNVAWIGEIGEKDSLENAIGILTESVKNRAYLQEGWKTGREVQDTMASFFNQLIRRRGWDLGAAFAARRPPEGVAIEALLNECMIGLSAFDRERLGRICTDMLQRPSHGEADVLNELGRISFAVEIAFQSPKSILLHKAVLPRCIYFDASVLLPAIVKGHPINEIYQSAIRRLREASATAAIHLKLKICTVYLNEVITHRKNAEAYAAQVGKAFPEIARSDALFHGSANVNVYVGAYANWIEKNPGIDFSTFLARVAPYTTETQLKNWLTAQGFEVFLAGKEARYPDFYALLEKAYAGALFRGKSPILIEHDAIQLSILNADLLKSERSLFVTADRRLQSIVAESNFSSVAEMMISHVGLIQFIELLLGGVGDGAGLTQLMWSARISERAQAVRSYFTALGLEQYDEGIALAMPAIVERFAEAATNELQRAAIELDVEDPRKRALAFQVLGSVERDYLQSMRAAAEKLRTAAGEKS